MNALDRWLWFHDGSDVCVSTADLILHNILSNQYLFHLHNFTDIKYMFLYSLGFSVEKKLLTLNVTTTPSYVSICSYFVNSMMSDASKISRKYLILWTSQKKKTFRVIHILPMLSYLQPFFIVSAYAHLPNSMIYISGCWLVQRKRYSQRCAHFVLKFSSTFCPRTQERQRASLMFLRPERIVGIDFRTVAESASQAGQAEEVLYTEGKSHSYLPDPPTKTIRLCCQQ